MGLKITPCSHNVARLQHNHTNKKYQDPESSPRVISPSSVHKTCIIFPAISLNEVILLTGNSKTKGLTEIKLFDAVLLEEHYLK